MIDELEMILNEVAIATARCCTIIWLEEGRKTTAVRKADDLAEI